MSWWLYDESQLTPMMEHLLRIFPNLTFGLVLGIAKPIGPVLGEHVWPGDVVVSMPTASHARALLYTPQEREEITHSPMEVETEWGHSFEEPAKTLPASRMDSSGAPGQPMRDWVGDPQLVDEVREFMTNNFNLIRSSRNWGLLDTIQTSLKRVYESPDVRFDYRPPMKAEREGISTTWEEVFEAVREKETDWMSNAFEGTCVIGPLLEQETSLREAIVKMHGISCCSSIRAYEGFRSTLPCFLIHGITGDAEAGDSQEWKGFAIAAAVAYARQLLLLYRSHDYANRHWRERDTMEAVTMPSQHKR